MSHIICQCGNRINDTVAPNDDALVLIPEVAIDRTINDTVKLAAHMSPTELTDRLYSELVGSRSKVVGRVLVCGNCGRAHLLFHDGRPTQVWHRDV